MLWVTDLSCPVDGSFPIKKLEWGLFNFFESHDPVLRMVLSELSRQTSSHQLSNVSRRKFDINSKNLHYKDTVSSGRLYPADTIYPYQILALFLHKTLFFSLFFDSSFLQVQ